MLELSFWPDGLQVFRITLAEQVLGIVAFSRAEALAIARELYPGQPVLSACRAPEWDQEEP